VKNLALELEFALNHLIGNPVCNENAKSQKSQKTASPFWQLLNPLEKSRVQKIHQIRPEIGKANYPLKTDRAVSSFLLHQSSKKYA
jgi:hypothetical protein